MFTAGAQYMLLWYLTLTYYNTVSLPHCEPYPLYWLRGCSYCSRVLPQVIDSVQQARAPYGFLGARNPLFSLKMQDFASFFEIFRGSPRNPPRRAPAHTPGTTSSSVHKLHKCWWVSNWHARPLVITTVPCSSASGSKLSSANVTGRAAPLVIALKFKFLLHIC